MPAPPQPLVAFSAFQWDHFALQLRGEIEMLPIEIPFLVDNVRLETAIDIMQAEKCSAVLVSRQSGPVVLDEDVILNAIRNMGNRTVVSVRPRMLSIDVSQDFTNAADIMGSFDAIRQIEDLLDSKRAAFAYAGRLPSNPQMASILSRYESLDYIRRAGLPLWRCRRKQRHIWRQDQLLPGNRCPICNAQTNRV